MRKTAMQACFVTAALTLGGFAASFALSSDFGQTPSLKAAEGPAEGEEFEIEYNFDDAAELPEGWLAEGGYRVADATDFGILAQSGSNALAATKGMSTDVIYTPLINLEGGKPCTIEFYIITPELRISSFAYELTVTAGKAQTPDAQTITLDTTTKEYKDWEKIEYTFTPETTGEYCFAIKAKCTMGDNFASSYAGTIAFDTFFISGTAGAQGGGVEPPVDPVDPDKPQGPTEDFEADFDFDNGALPEGFSIDGSRLTVNTADYWGFTAQSGEYVLGATKLTAEDVIYTPLFSLVGGKEYTLQFQVLSPESLGNMDPYAYKIDVTAGSAQTPEGQTITVGHADGKRYPEWTPLTFTFTPEADGDFCFAVKAANAQGLDAQAKEIAFDSFYIKGTRYGEATSPDISALEPDEENLADCVELPYLEKFDGTNYTGDSYLPIGWASTGTMTFITASISGLPAVEGEYYMITAHNATAPRDDRAYTPFFNLEAGTEYTVDYSLFMQGNNWNEDEIMYLPELAFTVGTQQEADFHVALTTFSKATTDWERQQVKFTPKKSGPYCFAFMLTGPVNSGVVCVDNFSVTMPGGVLRPEPHFFVKGVYSEFNDAVTMVFENTPVQMVNTSKYGESYLWTAKGAEPESSKEMNPSFTFPSDGTYTVTLEVTNPRSSRSTSRTIHVETIRTQGGSVTPLSLYCTSQDKLLPRGATPTFSTDPEGDFVTGYNHYYFDVAQRYDFAPTTDMHITQMSLGVTDRKFRAMTDRFDDQRIKPLTITFYGANEDGSLDESNIFGSFSTTIGEALGSSGLGGSSSDYRDIEFPEPITVRGTFYVAMHFDHSMEIDPQDAKLGRSYLGTHCIQHGHGITTLYCKPYAKPENSDAELDRWQTVDKLDSSKAGLGAFWSLWCSASKTSGAEAAITDNADGFAASFAGDLLTVSGTTAGATVAVFTATGLKVAEGPAAEGTTFVSIPGLPAGIYIIASGNHSAKVLK